MSTCIDCHRKCTVTLSFPFISGATLYPMWRYRRYNISFFNFCPWIPHFVWINIYNRRIFSPFLQNRIRCNTWIEHPLSYVDIFHVFICRCRTIGTIHPPCAKFTVTIQNTTVVFESSQILLFSRPRALKRIYITEIGRIVERRFLAEIAIRIDTYTNSIIIDSFCCLIFNHCTIRSSINGRNRSATCNVAVEHAVYHHRFRVNIVLSNGGICSIANISHDACHC